MAKLHKKHTLATRWFHWLNFPLLAIMIWSGLLIYHAEPVYRVGIGDWTLIRFDKPFLKTIGIRLALAEGMGWHFFFGWLFAINGLLYALYMTITKKWSEILPNQSSLKESLHVILHDLRIRKDPPPQAKFNGAQKFAYTGVIAMGLGSLLSGLAIYKPVQLSFLVSAFGGYQSARWIHFWLCGLFVLFFVVHIMQVIRAGWNNFRSMITGHELVKEEAESV